MDQTDIGTRVPGISFVIVTYNSLETIRECLASVFAQETKPLEVIVVDNASADATPDFVGAQFPDAVVIRNDYNAGFGVANNTAARIARGEIVAMVNPDASLDPRWSTEITRVIENSPKCAAAEGKLLLADRPEFINCAGSSINLLGFGCMNHYGEPATTATEERVVGYASGAAFAIKRQIFLSVDGFDQSYFLYHDDVDLGLRVREAGWQINYAPRAIAYHHYKPELHASKVRYLERNRWKTLAKHMPPRYFLLCGPLLAISELGMTYELASLGLLDSKAAAILEFLRELPRTISARGHVRSTLGAREAPMELLTDEFPLLVPQTGRATLIGRRLLRGYHRAFLGGKANC
jgi:GT2 family glycosyltransferase